MIKCLSVRQPWAHAIVFLEKDIENRNWRTNYRGPVLIHAAKSMTVAEYTEADDLCASFGIYLPAMQDIAHFGGIIGRAEIVDCVTESDSPWFFGRFGFVLRNAEPLPFLPCRGQLGFFDVDDDDMARAEASA